MSETGKEYSGPVVAKVTKARKSRPKTDAIEPPPQREVQNALREIPGPAQSGKAESYTALESDPREQIAEAAGIVITMCLSALRMIRDAGDVSEIKLIKDIADTAWKAGSQAKEALESHEDRLGRMTEDEIRAMVVEQVMSDEKALDEILRRAGER
jgi:hypothetical protein